MNIALPKLFRVFPMAVFRFIYSPADAGKMPNNIVNAVINMMIEVIFRSSES
jgi:hypothetical protein